MVTPLKSRFDQRVDKQFEEINATIDSFIQKGDYESVNEIFNYAIKGTEASINSKYLRYESGCLKYREIHPESDSGKALKKELKALKKELYDEIGLLKKLNSKCDPKIDDNITSLNDEISSLDDDIASLDDDIQPLDDSVSKFENRINSRILELTSNSYKCKIFSILNKYFPSIFSTERLIALTKLECNDTDSVLVECNQEKYDSQKKRNSLFETQNYLHKRQTNLYNKKTNLYKLKSEIILSYNYIEEIEQKIIENQNENLNEEIWRPKKITRESLKSRITPDLLEEIKPLLSDEGFFNDFKVLINDLSFNDDFDPNGLTKLNRDFDLIVTSKNNYYLVLKCVKIEEGSAKIVYAGIDLSKKQPVAISYPKSQKQDSLKAMLDEESNYIKVKGLNNVIKIRDFLTNENEGIAIFISELHSNGDATANLKKINKKHEFCEKLIVAVDSCFKKGFLWRDCKPENTLLNKQFDPIITDLNDKDITIYYAAPEVILEQLKYQKTTANEKSVVWSLGVTLYRAFCDCFFDENERYMDPKAMMKLLLSFDDDEIAYRIQSLMDEQPENIPFFQIILDMLYIDPDRRLTLDQVKKIWEATSLNIKLWEEILKSAGPSAQLVELLDKYETHFRPKIRQRLDELSLKEKLELQEELTLNKLIGFSVERSNKLFALQNKLIQLYEKYEPLKKDLYQLKEKRKRAPSELNAEGLPEFITLVKNLIALGKKLATLEEELEEVKQEEQTLEKELQEKVGLELEALEEKVIVVKQLRILKKRLSKKILRLKKDHSEELVISEKLLAEAPIMKGNDGIRANVIANLNREKYS